MSKGLSTLCPVDWDNTINRLICPTQTTGWANSFNQPKFNRGQIHFTWPIILGQIKYNNKEAKPVQIKATDTDRNQYQMRKKNTKIEFHILSQPNHLTNWIKQYSIQPERNLHQSGTKLTPTSYTNYSWKYSINYGHFKCKINYRAM